jgi:beta-1,4-mannosyl-glycoprotein beta-1,4-N-acetylglucosaminyltransferase
MKKHKIIDTIFLYDEIDMLLFRLTELNEYVDHFIIMESNIDFLGNLKPFFFLENQNLFENWKDKITYLPTSDITLESISLLHDEMKKNRYNRNFTLSINRDNIQFAQLNNLKNHLLSTDLYFEDLILISDVDEIPDLSDYSVIMDKLKFSPVILRQKNFQWSKDYINTKPHLGTCCLLFTSIITTISDFFKPYFIRNNIRSQSYDIIDSGYHFSHFSSMDKTKEKLLLLNPEISESHIKYCWDNLISLTTDQTERQYILIEYEGELPKNIELIQSQNIGRNYSKKYTITLNYNKVESTFSLNVHINKDNQFDILLPSSQYYDILIEENTLENFQKMYGVNEIKKIISSFYPSSQDLFKFVNDGKFIEYSWAELKNEFIYDRIKGIL